MAALLTRDIPGCGGLFKAVPEDFVVEEVPAYAPSGEGPHLYLWVEKVGRDTQEVARALARAGGFPEREIGYAGQKDRQGITRQFFSVPAAAEPKLTAFEMPGVKVLWTKRHGNKLRTGHLRGNRFQIRLRDVKAPENARASFDRLCEIGMPNAFGAQRFGRADDNAEQGRKLLLGQRLDRAPTPFQRRLYLSAFQSLLFNRALVQRVEEGTLGTALLGDVMEKVGSGGLFVCESPEVDQPRVDAWEISPTGPMFGPKMVAAAGEVAIREAQLLTDAGVTPDDFRRGKGETEGTRRPYRVRLGEPSFEVDGADVLLAVTLPKGSYATVVLEELLSPNLADEVPAP